MTGSVASRQPLQHPRRWHVRGRHECVALKSCGIHQAQVQGASEPGPKIARHHQVRRV